jgi:hypothetical protein
MVCPVRPVIDMVEFCTEVPTIDPLAGRSIDRLHAYAAWPHHGPALNGHL